MNKGKYIWLNVHLNNLINGTDVPKGVSFKLDDSLKGVIVIKYFYEDNLINSMYVEYEDGNYSVGKGRYGKLPAYSSRDLDTILGHINTVFKEMISENNRIEAFIRVKESLYMIKLLDDDVNLWVYMGRVQINYRLLSIRSVIFKDISWLESGQLLQWLEEYRVCNKMYTGYYDEYQHLFNNLSDQMQQLSDSALKELVND